MPRTLILSCLKNPHVTTPKADFSSESGIVDLNRIASAQQYLLASINQMGQLVRGLILACLLLLVGCQLQSPPNDPGVVQLTLWQSVNPPANRDVLQALVERFNREHPKIQVTSLYVGQEDQQMP
ncbi:MAG: hypothetical protein WA828_02550, partial [Coleofasciculaceae cyanobacterium]